MHSVESLKATEQYSDLLMFITLYEVVLIFESVDKILRWGQFSSVKLLNSILKYIEHTRVV